MNKLKEQRLIFKRNIGICSHNKKVHIIYINFISSNIGYIALLKPFLFSTLLSNSFLTKTKLSNNSSYVISSKKYEASNVEYDTYFHFETWL